LSDQVTGFLSGCPEAAQYLEALGRTFFVASVLCASCEAASSSCTDAARAGGDSKLADSCQRCEQCWHESLPGVKTLPYVVFRNTFDTFKAKRLSKQLAVLNIMYLT
jgi:hypothetical protein